MWCLGTGIICDRRFGILVFDDIIYVGLIGCRRLNIHVLLCLVFVFVSVSAHMGWFIIYFEHPSVSVVSPLVYLSICIFLFDYAAGSHTHGCRLYFSFLKS